ncbi:MAG: ABC transporter ATP-binding protein [Alphaproteobacteria bacterium]|nr:ABC transporter ATP-binding protein [Alphaproteobacteria bacterium]MBU1573137.1 ABC transporter ATP-binding protein [Alphaproteobacteria bacterium]MBU2078113.1 ABC transporter ATP-binding protein [Alphaproteobacteria bacterium]MBU2242692.1 ABC transporter ATP-binding protein [Alphaproteobacteria bacterium]
MMTKIFKTFRAPSLETLHMSKSFGRNKALDDVSLKVAAGSFHALLGENGAGKSTLVKCMMGFYEADAGQMMIDGQEIRIHSPRDAQALGIGMVYQHFTLVPCLTAAENLVISRPDTPMVINWKSERQRLDAFMETMPFRVRLDAQVSTLSAGEKQKLEIIKLLYLDQRFLILDEPTSVLTPAEADEILGVLGEMALRREVTVLMISHKFREVKAFCDSFTVLRRGRFVGAGDARRVNAAEMSSMMIGDVGMRPPATRLKTIQDGPKLELRGVSTLGDEGRRVVSDLSLKLCSGEILGIAGVSGNGQSALIEVLSGQRPLSGGEIKINGAPFEPTRRNFDRFKVFGLPEEPMRNAVVPRMSVAENIAFRSFDKPPVLKRFGLMSSARMRQRGMELIQQFNIHTSSPDAPIETLSGGNVQRTVLARELSGEVDILIVANPCFGLDFASVADIRGKIMECRNRGAAVLLVSEDLDEIFEMSDKISVMSAGKISDPVSTLATDAMRIGKQIAGQTEEIVAGPQAE